MNASDRARRAAMLCCYFARNFAYFSVFRSSPALREDGFWLTVHGNFVDVCVLEWCKLFGNRNGKYHWMNVTSDPETFRRELLDVHGIDDAELKRLWNEGKDYRDDFVAHTETQETTSVPKLNVPYLLVKFYFRRLQSDFPALIACEKLPQHFDRYYDNCLKLAQEVLPSTKADPDVVQ